MRWDIDGVRRAAKLLSLWLGLLCGKIETVSRDLLEGLGMVED